MLSLLLHLQRAALRWNKKPCAQIKVNRRTWDLSECDWWPHNITLQHFPFLFNVSFLTVLIHIVHAVCLHCFSFVRLFHFHSFSVCLFLDNNYFGLSFSTITIWRLRQSFFCFSVGLFVYFCVIISFGHFFLPLIIFHNFDLCILLWQFYCCFVNLISFDYIDICVICIN